MGTIKQKALCTVLAPMMLTSLAACSPMAASFKPNPDAAKASDPVVAPTPPPPVTEKPDLMGCLNKIPDYSISPTLVNFQMTDSSGVTVGANTGISGIPVGAKLGVQYETGKLMTAMRVTRPLYGPSPLPDTQGVATAEKIGFDIGLSASIANLGFNQFTQTPLAKMSTEALIMNLQNLVRETPYTWSSQVSDIYSDSQFEISVGSNAGIQVGDEFTLHKVEYVWEGDPCQSNLKIIRQLSNVPFATAIASQAPAANTAALTVVTLMNGMTIEKHDRVVVSKLKTTTAEQCTTDWLGRKTCKTAEVPRLALKRSVQLQATTGEPIPFASGTSVQNLNINPMIDKLLAMIIADPTSTFYVVQ